ncbi:collagen binding domain-containing protein [Streptacidiphilus sp. EB103A]|uniref:MSCRAMM family protein n=1 Tax=Streptacidiphilus sp. EB103A TaxID=3156275 RepID=UPI0035159BDE
MSVPPLAVQAQPLRRRRYAIVLATATALAAGLFLAPGAHAADKWGPGYLIPDSQGRPDTSHIGAYGPPGASISGLPGLAYCADPDLIGPAGSGGYSAPADTSTWVSKITGAPVPAANVARAAYVLSTYGQTSSDAQAAAVDASIYTLLNPGSTYALPNGTRALQRLSYPNVSASAKTQAEDYLARAAEFAGPYTLEVHPGTAAKIGQKTTVALDVLSASGHKVPGIKITLTAGSAAPTSVTTDSEGAASTTLTPAAAGTVDLKASAPDLPGVALRAALPADSGAQRMLLAGGSSTASAQTQLTVTAPKGGIKVLKTDTKTGKPLPGVVFQVRDTAGKTVASGTTDAQGVWEADGLAPGAYTVHEVAAPVGYQLASDRSATVTDGTVTTVSVTDSPFTGAIKIVKTAADTGKPLAGVAFQIKDSTGKVVATGTTDAHGVWETEDLPPGTYTVHELKAVNGYQLAADQTTTVAAATVTVAVHDVRIPTKPAPKPRPVTITTLPKTGA